LGLGAPRRVRKRGNTIGNRTPAYGGRGERPPDKEKNSQRWMIGKGGQRKRADGRTGSLKSMV